MHYEIQRVPLWPLFRVALAVYFIVFLVGWLLYSLFFASIMSMFTGMVGEEFGPMSGIGGGALVLGGLFFAVFGAVVHALIALLAGLVYNAAASMFGGLLFQMREVDPFGRPTAGTPTATQNPQVQGGAPTPPPDAQGTEVRSNLGSAGEEPTLLDDDKEPGGPGTTPPPPSGTY